MIAARVVEAFGRIDVLVSNAGIQVVAPLVDKQIPEQAKTLGRSEQVVVRDVMLKETVDGEFTTVEEVAPAALFFASFESNALTGQSLTVSHGWSLQ